MKKALLTVVTIILFALTCIAQETIKHTVTKGETVKSIAAKYDTTIEKIYELNPKAKTFLFIGMTLNIPISRVDEKDPDSHIDEAPILNQKKSTATNIIENDASKPENSFFESLISPEHLAGSTKLDLMIGYNLAEGVKFKDQPFNMTFTPACNYYMTDKAYAGIGLGITINYNHSRPSSNYSITTSSFGLNMPLFVGLRITENIRAYTGPQLDYIISGKMVTDYDGNKTTQRFKDMDINRFSASWGVYVGAYGFRAGLRFGFKSEDSLVFVLGLGF